MIGLGRVHFYHLPTRDRVVRVFTHKHMHTVAHTKTSLGVRARASPMISKVAFGSISTTFPSLR